MRAVIVAVLLNGFLTAFGARKAEHVVVVVWDGMRPDFITESDTPTLHRLAQEGVFFRNHHPVFLTSTEVNGTAIATGAYPVHSGIMANKEYRPAISPLAAVGTESLEAVRAGDRLTGGHYLGRPTIAEILHDAGHTTVVAGTKPVVEKNDRLGAGDDRSVSGVVQNLRDSGPTQVMTSRQSVPRAHRLERFGAYSRERADGRAIFLVRHDAAVDRISSRGNRGSIDFGGSQKNRMMVPEEDAFLRQ